MSEEFNDNRAWYAIGLAGLSLCTGALAGVPGLIVGAVVRSQVSLAVRWRVDGAIMLCLLTSVGSWLAVSSLMDDAAPTQDPVMAAAHARVEAIRARQPELVAQAQQAEAEVAAAIAARDPQRVHDAVVALNEPTGKLTEAGLATAPEVAPVVEAAQRYAVLEGVMADLMQGRNFATHEQPTLASIHLDRAVSNIDHLKAEHRSALNMDGWLEEMRAEAAVVTTRAQAEQAEIDRKRREREVAEQKCGNAYKDHPSWLAKIEEAAKNQTHDPASFSFVGCGPVELTEQCWVRTCQMRANNALGVLRLGSFKVTQRHMEVVELLPL